ncbi:MAG: TIGR01777 family oxidoreductase [Niabella sp.]
MKKKIVLAGGTGFVGTFLAQKFVADGFDVSIISRNDGHINWNNEQELLKVINCSEVLINLAGKSVNCRYTARNKAAIFCSRVNTTRRLQEIIDQCDQPPQLWINSSTATIYRHSEDRPMDEITGETGTGFSVEVAKAWEQAFFEKKYGTVRKAALRIAIVLGKNGGVIAPYCNLVKAGLGGTQGNGRQMFSWIHIEDLYSIICMIMSNNQMQGIYNCAAPNPVTNKELMAAFRKILKPWLHLPAPALLLKTGAMLIGTETELILKSRWVIPQRLSDAGYQFQYPRLQDALEEIFH